MPLRTKIVEGVADDGSRHRIRIVFKTIEAGNFDDGDASIAGGTRVELLRTGETLNCISKGVYSSLDGLRLTIKVSEAP
jgi:hypothetical protein